MNLYTIYNSNTQEVIANDRPWPTSDGVTLPEMEDGIHILLQITETKPLYDPTTQKLKRLPVSYDIINKTATLKSWEVVDLTQEEIDAKTPAYFDIGGIKYDVSEQAQNAFTRMQSLIDHAGMALTDEVSVKDVLGISHTITVEDFNSDMIQYGLHCYTLFNTEPVDTGDLI